MYVDKAIVTKLNGLFEACSVVWIIEELVRFAILLTN